MSWKPSITVAAVVETGGRFLIVEELIRGRRVFNQPAGRVEAAESLLAAVVRETLEETAWHFEPEWLLGVKTIALTAGASAPECLVEEVVKFLGTEGFSNVQEVEVMPENVRFGLPPEIVEAIASAPAAAE